MSRDESQGPGSSHTTITSGPTSTPSSRPYTTEPVITRPGPIPSPSGGSRRPSPPGRTKDQAFASATRRPVSELRIPLMQSNGKPIYVYDADVSGVVAVTTDRHGPCLILHVRNADEVWVLDTPRNRLLLSMADNDDLLPLLGKGQATETP